MAEAAADIKEIGDKLVGLTLKQAVDLAAYLKETYQIEPAAGGVMMAGGGGGGGGALPAEVEEAKSTFDVHLKSRGRQEDSGHQGRSLGHRPGSEGSQGPCRSRSQAASRKV